MKVTILENVPGNRLPYSVPPAYRDLVRKKVSSEGVYTLLLFPHTERDVVTSMPVRRTFRRLEDVAPDGILAVGTTFTSEARDLLDQRNAIIVALREGKWTDASAAERQR